MVPGRSSGALIWVKRAHLLSSRARRPGEGRDPYSAAAVVEKESITNSSQEMSRYFLDPGLRRDDR